MWYIYGNGSSDGGGGAAGDDDGIRGMSVLLWITGNTGTRVDPTRLS